MPAPVSKSQAGLFGAVAGGQKKIKGFSKQEARDRLKGVKVSRLPQKAPQPRKPLRPRDIDQGVKEGKDYRL